MAWPCYQGIGLMISFFWLWGGCVYVRAPYRHPLSSTVLGSNCLRLDHTPQMWTRYRVNYIYIFDFDPKTRLTHMKIFDQCANATVVYLTHILLHYFHLSARFCRFALACCIHLRFGAEQIISRRGTRPSTRPRCSATSR